MDAREVLVVEEESSEVQTVDWESSGKKLSKLLSEFATPGVRLCLLVTGYVAGNTEGVATTLGRDGSDYSASIFGNLLSAKEIVIYTDVDGVLSGDPRRVPGSQVLPDVSFNEAMELAYFGAKVIHPKTMQPAIMKSPPIPIWIRNTFNPTFRGTRIFTSSSTHKRRDRCVCGFASFDGVAVLNVEGSGMVGVRGVAMKVFGTLEQEGINVVLIAQASSEHSVTLALMESEATLAKSILEEVFARDLAAGRISEITLHGKCSMIAAVGDGMSNTTGVAGRFFSALGDAKINVLAIAQGCSERNISCVVRGGEETRALRAVHAAFRLSHAVARVAIIMDDGAEAEAGIGLSLLKLLQAQRTKIISGFDVDLQVVCVRGEQRIVATKNGGKVDMKAWREARADGGRYDVFEGDGIDEKVRPNVQARCRCLFFYFPSLRRQ